VRLLRILIALLLPAVLWCGCAKEQPAPPPPQSDTLLTGLPPTTAKRVGPGQLWRDEPLTDVGLDENELAAGQAIVDALISDRRVDFVATYRDNVYRVQAGRGAVDFTRYRLEDGSIAFAVERIEKQNPFANQNPAHLPTLADIFQAGSNPKNFWDRSKPALDYTGPGDPRLRFLNVENVSYPFAYSRVASVFDAPDSPDLVVSYAPFVGMSNNGGHYGELNMAESRGVFVAYGPGVKPGALPLAARLHDVAPTVAKLLGVPPSADGNYLTGQDGRPLAEILTGETVKRVLLIDLSGMSNAMFDQLRSQHGKRFHIFNELAEKGARFAHGLIAPFPSADWPGEFTLATGADVGRHGILDNAFYRRKRGQTFNLVEHRLIGEQLMAPPARVETIFEALRRAGDQPEGRMLSASLGLTVTRGADLATLVRRGLNEYGDLENIEWPASMPPLADLPAFACDETGVPFLRQDRALFAQIVRLLLGDNAPRPRLIVWSPAAYLAAARWYGPYTQCAGRAAWQEAELVSRLLKLLVDEKLAAETTVLLVSDHGMRGVDQSRAGDLIKLLEGLGFAFRLSSQHLLYLPTLTVQVEKAGTLKTGTPATIRLLCTDGDSNRPVTGAVISVLDPGGGENQTMTSAQGTAEVKVTPTGNRVLLEVAHPQYNPHSVTLSTTTP